MQLSPHFHLKEFVPPELYAAHGEQAIRYLNPKLIAVCEWIRVYFGTPLIVNNWATGGQFKESGFRMPDTTTGAKLSQHKLGNAADLKPQGKTIQELYKFITENFTHLQKLGLSTIEDIAFTPTWVHISVEWRKETDLVIVRP